MKIDVRVKLSVIDEFVGLFVVDLVVAEVGLSTSMQIQDLDHLCPYRIYPIERDMSESDDVYQDKEMRR